MQLQFQLEFMISAPQNLLYVAIIVNSKLKLCHYSTEDHKVQKQAHTFLAENH